MKATPGRKANRQPVPARVTENREWLRDREIVLGRLKALQKFGGTVDAELLEPSGSVEVFGAQLLLDRGELTLTGEDGKFRLIFQEPGSLADGYFETEGEAINVWFGNSRLSLWPASSGTPTFPRQTDAIEVQQVVN